MFRVIALLVAGLGVAQAHDVITTKITWSKEVSRLVFKRCVMCHTHSDPDSAFNFMTYEKARPWAKAMKEESESRRMPPWQAIKGFGEFKDDRGLTQEEIETLSDWVEGGAPEGDPKYLPEVPKQVDWQDPAAPDGASERVVTDNTKINSGLNLIAIRPKDIQKGATAQIIAMRPDGTFEPLLWIYEFNPEYVRTYYYKAPISLPAGTQILVSPPEAGTVSLFGGTGPPKSASARTGF